jgi:hypothetical protein
MRSVAGKFDFFFKPKSIAVIEASLHQKGKEGREGNENS